MRLLFSFCPLRFCSLLSRRARRDTDRVTLARLGTAVPRRILTALAIPSLGKMPRSLQVPPGAPTLRASAQACHKKRQVRKVFPLSLFFAPSPCLALRSAAPSGTEIVTRRYTPLFRPRKARPYKSRRVRQRFGHRLKRAAKSDRSGKYSPCRVFAPSPCLALRSAAPSGTEIVTRRYTPLFRPRKARPYKSRRVRQRFGHRLKRAAKSDRSGKYSPCRVFAPSPCLALRSAAPSGTEIVTRRYTPLFRHSARCLVPYKSRRVHHDNARLSAVGKKEKSCGFSFLFAHFVFARFCLRSESAPTRGAFTIE